MARKRRARKEILVVKSKIREYIKRMGDFNVGSDLAAALSEKVQTLLEDASRRASENGRKTIQARDV